MHYGRAKAEKIREAEAQTDHLEDILGTYLVKLTSRRPGDDESLRATEFMKLIGDYERIADHAVNILESVEEMKQKNIVFSDEAGFIWSDLLTDMERVSDHCSNISGCVLDTEGRTMNIHENQRIFRDSDEEYKDNYNMFRHKYGI